MHTHYLSLFGLSQVKPTLMPGVDHRPIFQRPIAGGLPGQADPRPAVAATKTSDDWQKMTASYARAAALTPSERTAPLARGTELAEADPAPQSPEAAPAILSENAQSAAPDPAPSAQVAPTASGTTSAPTSDSTSGSGGSDTTSGRKILGIIRF